MFRLVSYEKIFFVFIIVFFAFRDVFIRLNLEEAIIITSFMYIFVQLVFNIYLKKIKKLFMISFLIILISFAQFIINLLIEDLMATIIGYISIFGYHILWVFTLNKYKSIEINELKKWYYFLISTVGIFVAIIGVYQYLFDPSIFGLVVNRIYGNPDILSNSQVSRRATGFLGSPQNYALFLGAALLSSNKSFNKLNLRYLLQIILIIGGIVSGSRTFAIFFISFLAYNFFFKKSNSIIKKLIFLLFVIFVLFFLSLSINQPFVDDSFFRILNFEYFPAFEIIVSELRNIDIETLLWGKGITYGVYNEFQNSLDYSNYESYIVSLFIRVGIIQIILFLTLYLKAILTNIKNKDYITLSILLPLLINIFATPSFGGLQMSFVFWGIILMALSKTTKDMRNRYVC